MKVIEFRSREQRRVAEARALIRRRRRDLEQWIEQAIAMLDFLDGNPEDESDGIEETSAQAELRGGANVRAF